MPDLISVIMPVHNTEPEYLSCAFESVLGQTHREIQFIIIDDGSTNEKTIKLCDDFAENDSRIKLVHQKNTGYQIARNNGMKLADGKWLYFMDSDDWLERDTFELAIKKLNTTNTDVCIFDYEFTYPNKKRNISYDTKKDVFYDLNDYNAFALFTLFGVPWNLIYKTDIIKGKLEYKDMTFEDTLFVFSAYPYISSFSYLKKVCYHYRQLPNSYIHTLRDDYKERINLFYDEMTKNLDSGKVYPESADKIRDNYYIACFNMLVSNVLASRKLSLMKKRKILHDFVCSERFQKAVENADTSYINSRTLKIYIKLKKPNFLICYLHYLYCFFTQKI